jgi:hypothetical protein
VASTAVMMLRGSWLRLLAAALKIHFGDRIPDAI